MIVLQNYDFELCRKLLQINKNQDLDSIHFVIFLLSGFVIE